MKKLSRLFALVLAFLMLFNTVALAETVLEPTVSAKNAVLYNPDEDTVLYSKNMDAKMYPASMTKILTAMIVLEYFEPTDLITVGTEINEVSLDSSKAGHILGETLSIETVIRGLIIPSGNDTSVVAAAAVAKKYKNDQTLNYSQSMTIFSSLMNEKAKEFGCKGTNFSNPHGYHADDHYTTCYDLALIVKEALKNELICKIAQERSYYGSSTGSVAAPAGAITQEYSWTSHNLLITGGEYYYQHATGLKTGFTDQAGSCIAATAEKDGTTLIAIISNSGDSERWVDATSLFEYGFNNFAYHSLTTDDNVVLTLQISNHKKDDSGSLDLIAKDSTDIYLRNDLFDALTTDVKINEEYLAENKDEGSSEILLKAPIEEGAEVGEISFISNGETVHTAKLYSSRTVEKAGIIQRIFSLFKTVFSAIFSLKGLIVIAVIVVIIVVVIILKSRSNNRYRSGYKFKTNRRRRF